MYIDDIVFCEFYKILKVSFPEIIHIFFNFVRVFGELEKPSIDSSWKSHCHYGNDFLLSEW